jgi:hypothetical protein
MARKLFKISFSGVLVFAIVLSLFSVVSYAASTPRINYFTVDNPNLSNGESTHLRWDVSGAEEIEIIGLEKMGEDTNLPMNGNREIWAFKSTTYVLNAYSSDGTMVSSTVDVNVGTQGEAKIISFSSNRYKIKRGESVKLSWTLENAKDAEIIGLEIIPEDKGIPQTQGSTEIWPFDTTTYVLQVVGYKGEIVSKNLTIEVEKDTPQNDPKIDYFTVNPQKIKKGQSTKLSWGTTNCSTVKIDPDVGYKSADGETYVTPYSTGIIKYTIKAYGNNGGEVTQDLYLTVEEEQPQNDPKINYFTVNPQNITLGQSATLTWDTSYANSVNISYVGIKSADGSTQVTPNSEGKVTYKLTAYGNNGKSVSKNIDLYVEKYIPPQKNPEIKYFYINPQKIKKGQSATIKWATENVKNVKISNVGYKGANGETQVTPYNEGVITYKLTAYGENGQSIDQSINLTVEGSAGNGPSINSFKADKNEVSRGTLVKLSWDTSNAQTVTILTSDGLKLPNRPVDGSISITPNSTRTYTLVASGNGGESNKDITVVVK